MKTKVRIENEYNNMAIVDGVQYDGVIYNIASMDAYVFRGESKHLKLIIPSGSSFATRKQLETYLQKFGSEYQISHYEQHVELEIDDMDLSIIAWGNINIIDIEIGTGSYKINGKEYKSDLSRVDMAVAALIRARMKYPYAIFKFYEDRFVEYVDNAINGNVEIPEKVYEYIDVIKDAIYYC